MHPSMCTKYVTLKPISASNVLTTFDEKLLSNNLGIVAIIHMCPEIWGKERYHRQHFYVRS